MSKSLNYLGQLQIHNEIRNIFRLRDQQDIKFLCKSVKPILYCFGIKTDNRDTQFYHTQEEIVSFINKYNEKYQKSEGFVRLTFERIRKTEYLLSISSNKQIQEEDWFKQFFNLQNNFENQKISFNLQKQSGGRYSQIQCIFCTKWKKCKVFILKDGIVTYNQSKNKIQQFLAFGKDFQWQISKNIKHLKIYIYSNHRKLSLKAKTPTQLVILTYTLQKYMRIYQKQQNQYRFNSFGPVRYNNNVQFYVDGAEYFEAVAKALEKAERQIFICGWWISPQFLLKRDETSKNIHYRLDKILYRAAHRDVKIYIIVYYESSFLTNDSAYTIKTLESLHNNIRVLRHPQIVLPTYWSHHQKLVVVDQQKAFTGGLDLCYGRYDFSTHQINNSSVHIFPGIQYNNCRIADFVNVRNFQRQNVQRNRPRLPWHDVALMVQGYAVKDLSKHFIQYWNYASYQTHYANRYVLVASQRIKQEGKASKIINKFKQLTINILNLVQNKKQEQRQIPQSNNQVDEQKLHKQASETPKIFKQNPFNKFKQNKKNQLISQRPKEQQMMILKSTKQSITNEAFQINQNPIYQQNYQRDLENIKQEDQEQDENQFEQEEKRRIQQTQKEALFKLSQIAKVQQEIQESENQVLGTQEDYLEEKQNQNRIEKKQTGSFQFFTNLKQNFKKTKAYNHIKKLYTNKKQNQEEIIKQQPTKYIDICQALRSVSQWSIGCRNSKAQKSIYYAYLSLISKAEKLIYIQNQFFISANHQNGVIKNEIMVAIYERIKKAIQFQQDFKVIIMMPLIPGFAGQLDDPSASLPRVIMNWQYKTISKGQNSLIGRLLKITPAPQKYIQFLGLRTHGLIQGQPTTQIIYLHSKLLIVDDRYLICGSANINDRSMVGERDSQLCLLVQAEPNKIQDFGTEKYHVVEKIHKLRVKLFKQHFAITQSEAKNPILCQNWQLIRKITTNNTIVYKQLFGCYPDDQAKYLNDIKRIKKPQKNLVQYNMKIQNIKGHAVIFPLKFLQKQKLTSFHPTQIST